MALDFSLINEQTIIVVHFRGSHKNHNSREFIVYKLNNSEYVEDIVAYLELQIELLQNKNNKSIEDNILNTLSIVEGFGSIVLIDENVMANKLFDIGFQLDNDGYLYQLIKMSLFRFRPSIKYHFSKELGDEIKHTLQK